MVGWHHQLDGHEFEQAPGDGERGGLACCSPWGHKESDTTEQLNNIIRGIMRISETPPPREGQKHLHYKLWLRQIPVLGKHL